MTPPAQHPQRCETCDHFQTRFEYGNKKICTKIRERFSNSYQIGLSLYTEIVGCASHSSRPAPAKFDNSEYLIGETEIDRGVVELKNLLAMGNLCQDQKDCIESLRCILRDASNRPVKQPPAAPTDDVTDAICKNCGAKEYGACVSTDCPVGAYKSHQQHPNDKQDGV